MRPILLMMLVLLAAAISVAGCCKKGEEEKEKEKKEPATDSEVDAELEKMLSEMDDSYRRKKKPVRYGKKRKMSAVRGISGKHPWEHPDKKALSKRNPPPVVHAKEPELTSLSELHVTASDEAATEDVHESQKLTYPPKGLVMLQYPHPPCKPPTPEEPEEKKPKERDGAAGKQKDVPPDDNSTGLITKQGSGSYINTHNEGETEVEVEPF